MSDDQHREAPKPGAGIDRTLIRQLIALPPAERMRLIVESSRNVAAMLAKKRFK